MSKSSFNPAYYYQAYFNFFHFSHWFYKKKIDQILSEVPASATTALDCGTASGLVPYLLESKGVQADGFDIIEEFVTYGNSKLKKGKIYQDDITSFNAHGSYDCVICIDVIRRFPREMRDQILRRMAATLNPGGTLILVNPSPFWFYINPIWRFLRKQIFRRMVFQDDLCGANEKQLKKVEYYDEFAPLVSDIPEDIFLIERNKIIAYGLLTLVKAKLKMKQ